jgi:hypothetical protein
MGKTLTTCAVCLISLGLFQSARADVATAYVGSVNGTNAFEVQQSGNQLYFHPQPDSNYVWMENNGSPPGTIATYTSGDQTYNRDGMKTFACTDVAYGQRLDSIKLEFDYFTGADPTTGIDIVYYPTINVFITDGAGHYGVWSATSGGTPFTTADVAGEAGWKRLTLDCTNLTENTWGQVNEYNGGLSTSKPLWSVIRGWEIAGFYDFQRTPEGGFEAWNETLWSDITNVGVADTTLNTYGISLSWGDTVGGMLEDGNGEIGSAANRAYGQAGRMINDYTVTVNGTTYDITFAAGTVPEPGTFVLLGACGLGLAFMAWRRRTA